MMLKRAALILPMMVLAIYKPMDDDFDINVLNLIGSTDDHKSPIDGPKGPTFPSSNHVKYPRLKKLKTCVSRGNSKKPLVHPMVQPVVIKKVIVTKVVVVPEAESEKVRLDKAKLYLMEAKKIIDGLRNRKEGKEEPNRMGKAKMNKGVKQQFWPFPDKKKDVDGKDGNQEKPRRKPIRHFVPDKKDRDSNKEKKMIQDFYKRKRDKLNKIKMQLERELSSSS